MLQQAIDQYHALLDPAMAQASQDRLTEELRAQDLFFGDRPLATVLRPRFITADQYAMLQTAVEQVAAAARRVGEAALHDDYIRANLALTPGEERLIALDPGYPEPSAHGRMDTFLTVDGTSLQFVEYNAESPAAIAYQDSLSSAFLALPVMEAFGKQYRISTLPARQHLLDTLLASWRTGGGNGDPSIAIVDWSGLPTRSEFVLFQRYFHEHGLDAVICTPDDLEYRDRVLYANNGTTVDGTRRAKTPVTLVYKRVLTSELLMHYGEAFDDHPLAQAYADGTICMVNSFRAKLLHKKSIFALLTDDTLRSMFSDEERAAIAKHVPWTRLVHAGTTTYGGDIIDLLEFARTNRDRLLLKPNDEYGGKGIVVGWETDEATWETTLAEAQQSPFVVQERVEIAYEDYPALVDGHLHIGRRLVDSDPFIFGNQVHGSLTRLSTVTLLNVTAGGGSTVPMFVIDKS